MNRDARHDDGNPFSLPRIHSSFTAFSANVLFTCLRVCLFFVCCRHICKVFLYILMMPNSPSHSRRQLHRQRRWRWRQPKIIAIDVYAPQDTDAKWNEMGNAFGVCFWWRTDEETGKFVGFHRTRTDESGKWIKNLLHYVCRHAMVGSYTLRPSMTSRKRKSSVGWAPLENRSDEKCDMNHERLSTTKWFTAFVNYRALIGAAVIFTMTENRYPVVCLAQND